MIAITLCASKDYLYAWKACYRRVIAAAAHYEKAQVIFVSDGSEEGIDAGQRLKKDLPSKWELHIRHVPPTGDGEKYKHKEQLFIAAMQGEAFSIARQLNVDLCWHVEADVLPPPDALRVSEWTLQMPTENGSSFYDLAMCVYPNALFMGGRGDPAHPIAPNYTPEELVVPPKLKRKLDLLRNEEKEFVRAKKVPDDLWRAKSKKIIDAVNACPPIGNVWKANAEFGWKPRGWIDFAYPGVGLGAIVPIDWLGTGCVLLSKRALAMANFEGYDGGGTQDLFLCWKRWNPAGLRMAALTHCPCSHVKSSVEEKSGVKTPKYTLLEAVHEQVGPSRGHLRVISKPWVDV
jgi:hypothetical protein